VPTAARVVWPSAAHYMTMMERRQTYARLVLGALVALFCACKNDSNVARLYPEIVVTPEAIDFGGVVAEYVGTASIEVFNAGNVDLDISDLRLEGDQADAFVVTPPPIEVARDESAQIEVQFWPDTYIDYAATLVIESNDEETPSIEVPLTGKGIPAPTPDISVDETVLEFTVASGDDDIQWFTITNVGDDTLVITNTVQADSGAFEIVGDPMGSTLGPDESTEVIVRYAPTWDKGDHGSFTIFSNDPDEPEVTVTMLGNGGGDFEYPVAVIDGPTTADPLDTVTLTGIASYDPGGYLPLTYEWSVVTQPGGADVAPTDPAGVSTGLWLPVAGTWVVELVVTNTIGVRSAPAKHTIEVTPGDDLWIELTWDTNDTDFDLHLAQQGVDLFGGDGDCNYCNQNPDWATTSSDDDPDLALDNVAGYGPEDVRLKSPEDGEYPIRVHYYDDFGGGTTTATVNVWIAGVLADSRSATLEDNNVWEVGYVRFPDGVFIPDGTVEDEAPRRNCP
jgi:hypothetical protein